MPAPYVELHSHSNFSFLDGGSHPYELAMRAAELEMPALAITDRGGVYGAVRHLQACRKLGVKPIIGTSLEGDGEAVRRWGRRHQRGPLPRRGAAPSPRRPGRDPSPRNTR